MPLFQLKVIRVIGSILDYPHTGYGSTLYKYDDNGVYNDIATMSLTITKIPLYNLCANFTSIACKRNQTLLP